MSYAINWAGSVKPGGTDHYKNDDGLVCIIHDGCKHYYELDGSKPLDVAKWWLECLYASTGNGSYRLDEENPDETTFYIEQGE